MLWRLAAPGERLGAMPFGSGTTVNVEKWRCVATLRGHNGDVVGVAWSPDARRLASVSLDNTVRVWDCSGDGDVMTLVKVLEGHHGMAKGVAWDPIGRYIASHGDDHRVILWDARDWQPVARIEEPFQRTSQKTLFRRLGFSSDGQFLCCPHAYKKPANIAVVHRRPAGAGQEWPHECDFVGHSNPVVCAAFNPRIFRRALPAAAAAAPTAAAAARRARARARRARRTAAAPSAGRTAPSPSGSRPRRRRSSSCGRSSRRTS